MYSEELYSLVEATRPSVVQLSDEKVAQLAHQTGLSIESHLGGRTKLVARGENPLHQSYEGLPLAIVWSVAIEDATVTWTPRIEGQGSCFCNMTPNIRSLIGEALPLPPVRTHDLSELVVKLPIPTWLRVVGDDPWAEVTSILCLKSEAEEKVRQFQQKLEEALSPRSDAGN